MEFKEESYSNKLGYFHQTVVRYVIGFFIIYRAGGYLFINGEALEIALGILFILVGLIIFWAKRKIEIDFKTKKYRYLYSVFGLSISLGYKDLPAIEYVSVLKEANKNEIEVNLIYGKTKRIETGEFTKKDEAISSGVYFSRKLDGLRILDATVRPFEWIDV